MAAGATNHYTLLLCWVFNINIAVAYLEKVIRRFIDLGEILMTTIMKTNLFPNRY